MSDELREDAFAGRDVVVTGALSGIGAATAAAFARVGARVVAAGLARPSVQTPPTPARVVELDVRDGSAVGRFFSALEGLDVLVNCAGVIERREEYDLASFERVLGVNLTGTLRCSLAARPALLARRGCVVNIASMTSFFASPHAPAYGASKAGIVQLTKSLAAEFAPQVRVNAIAPGWIRTELTGPVSADAEANRKILERTPLGRWGEADEVADAVVFLASRAARFVTGAVLAVDGGYSAT